MPELAGRPPGRYGESASRPRPGVVAAVVVLATAFVGWVVWAALGAASPLPLGQVTAFRITSDEEIEVRVRVVDDSDDRVSCGVQALDRTREVVGVARVELPAGGDDSREEWVRVRTRDRAVTATVGRCGYGSGG